MTTQQYISLIAFIMFLIVIYMLLQMTISYFIYVFKINKINLNTYPDFRIICKTKYNRTKEYYKQKYKNNVWINDFSFKPYSKKWYHFNFTLYIVKFKLKEDIYLNILKDSIINEEVVYDNSRK